MDDVYLISDFLISRKSILLQVTLAFVTSLVLAPLSVGIVYFFFGLILYEMIYAVYKKLNIDILVRLGIICSSILGYIIGRLLYGDRDNLKQMREFDYHDYIESWRGRLPFF